MYSITRHTNSGNLKNILLKHKSIIPLNLFSSSTSEHCSAWIRFTIGSTADKRQYRYCNLSLACISLILALKRKIKSFINTWEYFPKQIAKRRLEKFYWQLNNREKMDTLIRLSPRMHTLQLHVPRHAGQTLWISTSEMSEYLEKMHQFVIFREREVAKDLF